MEYPLMEPPFKVKTFNEMNKQEVTQHFNWYIGEIPNRIQLLRTAFEYTGGGNKELLNFSTESLKNLWSWYIPLVTAVDKTEIEIIQEIEVTPKWLKNTITGKKISTETLTIGMDIAIYFGKVFVEHFNNLNWGVVTKPKSLVYVNRPVIVGFKNKELDPRNIIYNLTLKIAEDGDKNTNALYELFKVWEEFI